LYERPVDRYFTTSTPVAPFVVLVKVYVPGVVKSLAWASLPNAGSGLPAGTLQSGGFVLPAAPVPMLPEFPAGTVDPEGAVGAANAAAGLAKVTLKHAVLFGVVAAVNVFGNTVVPTTANVTTAPGVVALGLFSTTASVAETVIESGKKMIPDPAVAVVMDIVAVTGSVIVIGNVAVFITPPTEFVAEMTAVPGLTPVMMPVAPTVATDGSLLKNAGRPIPVALVAARCVATVTPLASVYVMVRVSFDPAPFVEREEVSVMLATAGGVAPAASTVTGVVSAYVTDGTPVAPGMF
jgi:hypothetical protein